MRSLFLFSFLLVLAGCFPHEAGVRLAHFDTQAPAVGDSAPAFELYSAEGELVELADLMGDKPIVVQLGSRSCPVFRYRRHWVRELLEDYSDDVHFLVVYTIEAHPAGSKSPYDDEEWLTLFNRVTGVRIEQAGNEEERVEQARLTREKLNLTQLILVDNSENETWQAYGSASSPAFVIDREGKVALRQVWIEPKEIRSKLDELLGR